MSDDKIDVKAWLEEQDEDLAIALSHIKGLRAENQALQIALLSIITALEDKLPAVRDIVAEALRMEEHKALHPLGAQDPDEEYADALRDLAFEILPGDGLLPKH